MSDVYPITFSFGTVDGTKQYATILFEYSRTRKGQDVIRMKDHFDDPWMVVSNLEREFPEFYQATKLEIRTIERQGKPHKQSRTLMGGKLGYTARTWFENSIGWALVETIDKTLTGLMEDEIHLLDKHEIVALRDLAARTPDKIDSVAAHWAPENEDHLWELHGPDFSYDYLKELEDLLKPIHFKIVSKFS